MNDSPLLIAFAPGTRLERGTGAASRLPILQNGPPGTWVLFEDGRRVPLPTDQIICSEQADGRVRVGFGGMSFEGREGEHLVFHRVHDLLPPELLPPERGRRMTLEPGMVSEIHVDGRLAWTAEPGA